MTADEIAALMGDESDIFSQSQEGEEADGQCSEHDVVSSEHQGRALSTSGFQYEDDADADMGGLHMHPGSARTNPPQSAPTSTASEMSGYLPPQQCAYIPRPPLKNEAAIVQALDQVATLLRDVAYDLTLQQPTATIPVSVVAALGPVRQFTTAIDASVSTRCALPTPAIPLSMDELRQGGRITDSSAARAAVSPAGAQSSGGHGASVGGLRPRNGKDGALPSNLPAGKKRRVAETPMPEPTPMPDLDLALGHSFPSTMEEITAATSMLEGVVQQLPMTTRPLPIVLVPLTVNSEQQRSSMQFNFMPKCCVIQHILRTLADKYMEATSLAHAYEIMKEFITNQKRELERNDACDLVVHANLLSSSLNTGSRTTSMPKQIKWKTIKQLLTQTYTEYWMGDFCGFNSMFSFDQFNGLSLSRKTFAIRFIWFTWRRHAVSPTWWFEHNLWENAPTKQFSRLPETAQKLIQQDINTLNDIPGIDEPAPDGPGIMALEKRRKFLQVVRHFKKSAP